jgi:hypothetical protein
MELRLLLSPEERRDFAQKLVETRLSKGAGFSETRRSLVGEVHLAFGRLYGLFEEPGSDLNHMLAGLALHDLGSFPQSYPRPDLTHLPPESVIEVGELWAKAAGSARLIRQAASILMGQLQAQAVLVYPLLKPWNLSMSYKNDFDCAGEPIQWPYIRTLEGAPMYVQPMVSQGEKLAEMVRAAGQWGFRSEVDHSAIVFESPYRICNRRPRTAQQGGQRAAA